MVDKTSAYNDIANAPIVPEKSKGFFQELKEEGSAISASFKEQFATGYTTGLFREEAAREAERETTKLLSADEANTRYPDMPKPFAIPINEKKAEYLHSLQEESKKRLLVMQEGSFISNALGGSIGGIVDPIELGAGIVTGLAFTRAAKAAYAARGATAASAAAKASKLTNTIPFAVGENVAGNLALEVGLKQQQQNRLGFDYTQNEAVGNAIIGGIGGTLVIKGFAKGLGKVLDATTDRVPDRLFQESFAYMDALDERQYASMISLAEANMKAGKNPNLLEKGDPQVEYATKLEQKELLKEAIEIQKKINDESAVESDVVRMQEIEKRMIDIEKMNLDQAKIRMDANAPERDIGYDQEIIDKLQKAGDLEEGTNIPRKQLEELKEQVDALGLDEADKAQFEAEYKKNIDEIDTTEKIIDMAEKCPF